MLIYMFCRIYFLVCNIDNFSPLDSKELFWSFFAGLRFDFSAIFFVNIFVYLFYFIPFKFVETQRYQSIFRHFVIFINMLAILLNIIDTGYFRFQNGRSGFDFLQTMLFSEDTANLLPQYIRDYWYHLLTFIGLYFIMETWFPRYKSIDIKPQKFAAIKCTIMAMLFTGASYLLFRGFGVKSFSVVDAMRFTEAKYAPLTLNSTFTFFRTMGKSEIALRNYFNEEELTKIYSAKKQYNFSANDFTKKNVMIFILEGFSQRSIGALHTTEKGHTPFLDSIIQQSYTFTNAFANGTKSIQSVPAILSSIPQLTDVTIIGSKYTANKVDALPILLKNEGYKTAFFHGAFNGSMGFDRYCEAIGFDEYYGMNEFMENNSTNGNYDSDWGIFDDKFLLYTKNQLDVFQQPFFATVFTISSHHPYVVPEEYQNLFTEKRQELNALRYADFSLQNFFEAAKHSTWFKNTLFVFVADHTVPYSFEPDVTNDFISPVDKHRIPIIFYNPGDSSFVAKDGKIVQQTDIVPSILYQLKYSKPFVSFGENAFDTDKQGMALYYNAGTYTYIDSLSVIDFDGEKLEARCK